MTDRDRGTGYEEVVVRRAGDLGATVDSEPPAIRGLKDHGWGDDLKTPAWREIRNRLADAGLEAEDLEPKTSVATIWYDLDDWTYRIEYELEALQDVTEEIND